jgi:hypothetical protein
VSSALFFHPAARAEYLSALAWYRSRSRRAAQRFEWQMTRVIAQIESSSQLFPQYDAAHRFAVLRRFPYSVVYRVRVDSILVVAVAHSRRSASYWKGRKQVRVPGRAPPRHCPRLL